MTGGRAGGLSHGQEAGCSGHEALPDLINNPVPSCPMITCVLQNPQHFFMLLLRRVADFLNHNRFISALVRIVHVQLTPKPVPLIFSASLMGFNDMQYQCINAMIQLLINQCINAVYVQDGCLYDMLLNSHNVITHCTRMKYIWTVNSKSGMSFCERAS